MTIMEKRKALDAFCEKRSVCDEKCPLFVPTLRCGRGEHFCVPGNERMSADDVTLAYSIAFPDAEEKSGLQETMEKIQECGIKDSGSRREFNTGAVRDIQEGKGRCDLMPLDVVGDLLCGDNASIIHKVGDFQYSNDVEDLYNAIHTFAFHRWGRNGIENMLLEVSKHFEEGAKKYGEHNWEKGIPTHCYIDSAVRHYLKWLRGDKDEPHDRAFVWNILCCIWTCIHKPELNDYDKNQTESR